MFVVVSIAIFVLGRMATRGWSEYLLYNGDSLVLPLIDRSLREGEGIQWVMSSQLFVFPEVLIYEAISLITQDARATLVGIAVVTFVLLYAALRVTAHFAFGGARHRYAEIVAALLATALFAAFCVFEPAPHINGSSMATLFLLSTYYQGVVLVGLAAIALMLWVGHGISQEPWGRRRSTIYALVAGTMTAAATVCNPLYAMQVTAPLTLAIVVVWFAGRLRPLQTALLVGVNTGGALIGLWARRFVQAFLSSDVDRYIDDTKIPQSLRLLESTIDELGATSLGKLKLALFIVIFVVVLGLFVFALFSQARPRLRASVTTLEFLLTAFATFSFLTLVVGFVYTGSTTTRYLMPLFVFPLIALIAVLAFAFRHIRSLSGRTESRSPDDPTRHPVALRVFAVATAALSVGAVVAGAVSLPPVVQMVSGDDYVGADCFNDFVGANAVNGVGSFWITRQWEVYGHQEGDVLQVESDLRINPSMINLDSYDDKDFSFVVLEKTDPVMATALEVLGEPRTIIGCGDRAIYDYSDTEGQSILTQRIEDSLEAIRSARGLPDE